MCSRQLSLGHWLPFFQFSWLEPWRSHPDGRTTAFGDYWGRLGNSQLIVNSMQKLYFSLSLPWFRWRLTPYCKRTNKRTSTVKKWTGMKKRDHRHFGPTISGRTISGRPISGPSNFGPKLPISGPSHFVPRCPISGLRALLLHFGPGAISGLSHFGPVPFRACPITGQSNFRPDPLS